MLGTIWEFIWEISIGLFVAGTKFLFAPGWMRLAGYNYPETLLVCAIGGCLSVLFFYHVGGWFICCCSERFGKLMNPKGKERKRFTRMNRFIVKVKKRFGVRGIALLTPPVFSVPLGTLLAARYYSKKPGTVRYLLYSVILWDFILSTLVHIFRYNI